MYNIVTIDYGPLYINVAAFQHVVSQSLGPLAGDAKKQKAEAEASPALRIS